MTVPLMANNDLSLTKLVVSLRLVVIGYKRRSSANFAASTVAFGRAGLSLLSYIWSATGQDYYAETRSTVLAGTDGIVFVADSNPSLITENQRCWEELRCFFGERLTDEIPVVFALNKRDIWPMISRFEFIRTLGLNGTSQIFETVATQGSFTLEILQDILRRILLGPNLAQPK